MWGFHGFDWSKCLFVVLCLGILGCFVYLLVPQPVLTVKVESLSVPAALPVGEVIPLSDLQAVSEAEEGTLSPASGAGAGKPSGKHKKDKTIPVLNINQATAQELEQLPGVGPKLAERIVTYRKENGAFKQVDDLLAVKGIGPKNFATMRPYLKL